MASILIIDDESVVRNSLEILLAEEGHRPYCAGSAREGFALLQSHKPEIVLLDIRLPETDGIEMLAQLLSGDPNLSVIMITGLDDMQHTVTAMQKGAFDYITKPIDFQLLRDAIQRALRARSLSEELGRFLPEDMASGEEPVLIGKSRPMLEIFKTIGSVSRSRVTVFIEGESGTGKELIARAIHRNSDTRKHPFVPVNCTALPEGLLESELFGHVKGAFTGAVSAKRGKFELAGEGTIFLDEIGDMSPLLQAKLLRVLQEKEFEKVGGESTLPMRARVIAATHRNLEQLVTRGAFREDLYYRLKIVTISVPPLRERAADIPLLVEHILAKLNRQLRRQVTKISPEALDRLQRFHWPGNVRQLENVLTRALVQCKGDVVMQSHISLPKAPFRSPGDAVNSFLLKDAERQHILRVLQESNWQKSLAARRLGISKPTLYAKIKEYGLSPDETDSGTGE